jgi:hypothetical protein
MKNPEPLIVVVDEVPILSVLGIRVKVQEGLDVCVIYDPLGALVGPVGPMEVGLVFIVGSTFFVAIANEVPPDMGPVTQLLHIFASILVEKYNKIHSIIH